MARHLARLATLLLALPLAVATRAQSCAAGPPTTLGTATVIATCGTGPLPRTTCQRLRVDCAGIPLIEVDVRVTEPEPGVPLRGTVVLGTGGGGNDFYGGRPGGPELFAALLARGFRVVDRAWSRSWFGDGVSIRKQSCRYATLLTWLHTNVHTAGAFCATGNSGGSAELCYALSSWGRGDILDVAVPSGGPPMARLDYLCLNPPEWRTLCRDIVPANVMECGHPGCNIQPGGAVCTGCNPTPTAADLEADSILHPAATLAYPRTRVHVVIGASDCSSAVPNGLLFYRAVTSEKAVSFAPNGTPHWVAQTAEGRDALLRALLGGAACGAHPATLAWQAWPRVGGQLDLEVHGPAGALYEVLLGFDTLQLELPPWGWLFVGAPLLDVGGGTLHPVTGRATFSLRIPANPALAGLPVFDQAFVNACFSNLTRIEIVP